jgi:hypothetical protein
MILDVKIYFDIKLYLFMLFDLMIEICLISFFYKNLKTNILILKQ